MMLSDLRRLLSGVIALMIAIGWLLPTTAQEATPGIATGYELPGESVFPEGVAYDPATGDFFVGSTEDGTIFRGHLATGEVTEFAAPGTDGRTAVTGIKVGPAGRLYVAGRDTGSVYVYDIATGALIQRFTNNAEPGASLINDMAVTADGTAYLTDSFRPVLYRIAPEALAAAGTPSPGEAEDESAVLEEFVDFSETAFAYQDGFNANGIVATPDGAFLLIVQFNTGQLYRVEIATQAVSEVDLGGSTLQAGDGLALDGQTLWVVRDEPGVVVPVTLSADYAAGAVGAEFADPTFDYPTTLALIGDGTALVVNSQLDMAGGNQPPVLPFTISRVALPANSDTDGTATPEAG